MKVTKLDWQVATTMERIVADITFENFDQTFRFMNVLITFIQEERARAKASHPPEAPASEHDTAQQGKVQSPASEPVGADGEHPEQANAGSVR